MTRSTFPGTFRSLLACAALGLTASSAGWAQDPQVDEPGRVFTDNGMGQIVVEAEGFFQQESDEIRRWHELAESEELPDLVGAGDPAIWTEPGDSAAGTASGQRFLRILPDTRTTHDDELIHGENFSPQPGKIGIIKYRVQFEEVGRYYVWVRAFSRGTEDNGIHVGLNDAWPESGQRMQWCDGKHAWRWECAQRTPEEHCGVKMQIFLDIEEPGEHTVSFSMREDGFAFDQFLLTKDIEFRPEGAIVSKSTED